MKSRWILATAIALVASAAYGQEARGKRVELKSVRDKASYGVGMMMGSNFKKQGVDLDIELLVQGLREGAANGKLLLSDEEAAQAVEAFEKEVSAKQAQQSKQFLVTNKSKPGVKTTPSGLQYKVIKAGNGPRPKLADAVTVQYRGTFINGSEFDNSGSKPFTIAVSDVIDGWKEALQMMPVGSKWQLFVPSELAYGEQGQPPIGPNATLVFDLELLEIAKKPPTNIQK